MIQRLVLSSGLVLLGTLCLGQSNPVHSLPDAPPGPPASQAETQIMARQTPPPLPNQNAPVVLPRVRLTRKQAETLVIRNNPQITGARLQALAAQQVVREVRSSYWPTAVANLTAVDSQTDSRITSGGLNNPIIFERAAGGAAVSQLVTDFGRTKNLVASARFSAKAQDQNALATREQVLLAVDQAFYGVLQAQAVLQVANETVANRQVVVDQVQALAKSALKSDLDLSFAQVNLAQAKLLLLDAQNNEKGAQATLAALLGYVTPQEFDVVDDPAVASAPPANVDELIAQAVNSRPELQAINFQYQSAEKLKTAERDSLFPTIAALGAAGGTPVRDYHLSPWYGAVGVNMEIPVFNGFLFSARAKEADLRAQVVEQRLVDVRNTIARDVRTSWLNANTAYDRLDVTNQLLKQANLALDLAQTRYKLGLSSIVELSQAQLQQTQAEISQSQAGYEYRLARAILQYQTTGL
ncbi:MAG: TolC family protein [Acidobacteriia bacterium]|nr:TolC family protein [Terriglobia bacterium]